MPETPEGHLIDASPDATPGAPGGGLIAPAVEERGDLIGSNQPLHDLARASAGMVGELALPVVLQRVVDFACELVDARSGALAVLDAEGTLEQTVQVGMDSARVAAIRDQMKGPGQLRTVIEEPHPVRLPRLAEDEHSADLATQPPLMGNVLGLPIRSRSKVVANLYLADRQGGDFTIEDGELLTAFAATAGLAIEDARLYEQAEDGQRRLAASAEISGMLLARDSGSDPQQVIIEKVCQLADADLGTLVVPMPDPKTFEVAVATGSGADLLRGMTYPAKNSMVRLAMDTARGIRVEAVDQQHRFEVHLSQVADVGPVMAVPLSGRNGPQGALVVGRRAGRHTFTRADLELAEAFASHAALARELADARADQQRLSLLKDRARIARDLHDHVIQQLFAAGLTMQSMAAAAATPELADRLDSVIGNLNDTIRQIRTSILQLQNSDAAPSGIRSVVIEIIDQITPALGYLPTTHFHGPLDTIIAAAELDAIAAVVREAVTNVAKHAQATELDVELTVEGNQLTVDVTDNGIGIGANANPRRSGLDNLTRRADIWGGTLTLTANQPHGTRLVWTIPLL
jgi:signal transduction histidine kinase